MGSSFNEPLCKNKIAATFPCVAVSSPSSYISVVRKESSVESNQYVNHLQCDPTSDVENDIINPQGRTQSAGVIQWVRQHH